MSPESADWWARAVRSFQSAKLLLSTDPDKAASLAYYAAFYAVRALFSVENRHFRKHSAVKDAVHRDLVHAKRWPEHLGTAYDDLLEARIVGDYGGSEHVSSETAMKAIESSRAILHAVRSDIPEPLPEIE